MNTKSKSSLDQRESADFGGKKDNDESGIQNSNRSLGDKEKKLIEEAGNDSPDKQTQKSLA